MEVENDRRDGIGLHTGYLIVVLISGNGFVEGVYNKGDGPFDEQ